MKKHIIVFRGNKKRDEGVSTRFVKMVEAETEEQALLILKAQYDNMRKIIINGKPL